MPAGDPEPEAPDEDVNLIELSQRVLVERGRLFSAAIIQLCDPASPLGAPVECLATLEKIIANALGNPSEPRVRQVRTQRRLTHPFRLPLRPRVR